MTSKKIFITIFKWILVAIPFIWIFTRVEFKELGPAFTSVAKWTIPVLIFNILLAMLLQGFRWWLLLRGTLNDISLGTALRYHFYGIFYSIVLPGSAAQDVVKAALIARRFNYSQVWGATWTFKLFGLLCMVLLSMYGLINIDFSEYTSQEIPTHYIFFFFLFIALLVILSFSKGITRHFRFFLNRFIPRKIMVVVENIRQGVYQYKNMPGLLVISFLISLVTQCVFFGTTAFLLKGITGSFYFTEVFAFIPIIEILCVILPLTPNGSGIRESLATVMFTYLGLSHEQIAIYVALSGLVPVLLKLVGVLPFVIVRKSKGTDILAE